MDVFDYVIITIIKQQLIIFEAMESGEIMEGEEPIAKKESNNPELVCIRKRLADPNKILPGLMPRSRLPIHLLPVQAHCQSQSGHQMPLDSTEDDVLVPTAQKGKTYRPKNMIVKTSKFRTKSQISQNMLKQKVRPSEQSKEMSQRCVEDDPIEFLCRNLKSILNYSQKLVFVSKTLLIGNVTMGNDKYKQKEGQQGQREEINKMYVRQLFQMPYFATILYAFDRFKSEQLLELPSFVDSNNLDLKFDDDFESSNLFTAMHCDESVHLKYQHQPIEKHVETYMLTVRLDYNTKSYGQWFYFKVKRSERPYSFSRQQNNLYKFMIVNMTKSSSMFGKGLKISVCRNGVWRKEGTNIRYYKNTLKRDDSSEQNQNPLKNTQRYYRTLEFTLEIYEGQEIYISYNEPYTYSRVGQLLDKISNVYEQNRRNIIDIRRHVICPTYLNNIIEVINFTAHGKPEESQEQKKIIFIVSRCHPIQTAGSHVMEGILTNLCSLFIDSPLEQQKTHIIYKLLQRYVIKVIPMLNPDGVILGNSRCNIAGYDLNRSWKAPKADSCREVFAIKKYILKYQNRIAMFIDLHAHSKKKNVFAYGCHDIADPFSTREFPYLLSKLSENDFIFSQCRFARMNRGKSGSGSGKEGTARMFLYDLLRIPNVFTIENSYCSAKNSMYHYDKASYELIGGDILKAISLYFSPTFKQRVKIETERDPWKEGSLAESRYMTETESERQKEQSIIQLSVNPSVKEISLKVRLNSQKEIKESSVVNLREKYLNQLRLNSDNVKMGLRKDEGSESEDEDRIYEINAKDQSRGAISQRNQKNSRTTERLASYLQNTKSSRQNEHSPIRQKESLRQKKVLPLNLSSTRSEVKLNKVGKISKTTRLHTINQHEEYLSIPEPIQFETLDLPTRGSHSKQRKATTEVDIGHSKKKQTFISVVDIGLEGRSHTTHNYRFNLSQKNDKKSHSKPIQILQASHFQDKVRRQTDDHHMLDKKREEEVKEYLRKLIRPKTIIERRQKQITQERNDKQKIKDIKLKQSSIQFSNLRLTRMLMLQSKAARTQPDYLQ